MSNSDETMLEKVRALLAKAHSTEFPAEAEAFIAKANALMARHAIDEAMLAASSERQNDPVMSITINVEGPYISPKHILLDVIAKANTCQAIGMYKQRGSSFRPVAVYGHKSDLELVELTFTSLLMHAATEMERAVKPHQESTKAFRQAFLLGYARRIGQRLTEARRKAVDDVDESASSVHLALIDRASEVTAEFKKAHPQVVKSNVSSSSIAGARGGQSAANRADTGQRRMSSRRGLSAG